jgi:predicted amidohydrolase
LRPRLITIAACAPASYGFVAEPFVPVTERIIKGEESEPSALASHVERLLDHQLQVLAQAAQSRPTLAMIPEDCLRLANVVRFHQQDDRCAGIIASAEARYLARIGAFCREHGCFVVGGTVTLRAGRYYNTAILQDPSGVEIARYDKTHLPCNGEHETFSPGHDLPVFETPLGRIGMLICWDIVFPEPFAVLALKGAELILQPTFGHWEDNHDLTARARCQDWHVPMAVSMWGGCANIIDQSGKQVAHTGRVPNSVAIATLDLAAPSRLAYLPDARALRLERRPELYQALVEKSIAGSGLERDLGS